jgi:transposase
MPNNQRRTYTAEFRQQLIELVSIGRSPYELAKEFDVHFTTVLRWCQAASVKYSISPQKVTTSSSLSDQERLELLELRKKLKRVEMERDILAKATAWFANNKD